jgi:tetratricopeptide (TPR) repeat protein
VHGLATQLADSAYRLEALHAGDLAVRASFDVSVRALERRPGALDPAAANAFGLLSLPDGPDMSVAAAARLLAEPEPTAGALMERLVDEQLLEMPRPGRYQFHDLVRLYAREYATRRCPQSDRAAALDRVMAFYTATAWQTLAVLDPRNERLEIADPRWSRDGMRFEDGSAALRWLEAERPNLMAAMAQAAGGEASAVPPEMVGQLAAALSGFFKLRGHAHDWVRANEIALGVARRHGDEAGQALALRDLGVALGRLGRYEEQLACFQDGLTLSRGLGMRQQAAALNCLGTAYLWLGRYSDAVSSHLESLRLYRQLDSRHGQALSLNNLGMAYERLERFTEALDCYQEALQIDREHGSTPLQGAVLNSLGGIYLRLRRYDDAIACQNASLAVCHEVGDRLTPAHCLHELGLVYHQLGRPAGAIACLGQSLAIFRELGDRRGVAVALRDLGDAFLAAGDDQRARAAWEEALAISIRLPTPEADEIRARLAGWRAT